MPPIHLLAQAVDHLIEKTQSEVLYWGTGLILVALAGGMVIAILRRYLKDPPMQEGQSGGFSLADLKRMRAQEQFTEEEYQAAKTKLISRLKQAEKPTPPPEATP